MVRKVVVVDEGHDSLDLTFTDLNVIIAEASHSQSFSPHWSRTLTNLCVLLSWPTFQNDRHLVSTNGCGVRYICSLPHHALITLRLVHSQRFYLPFHYLYPGQAWQALSLPRGRHQLALRVSADVTALGRTRRLSTHLIGCNLINSLEASAAATQLRTGLQQVSYNYSILDISFTDSLAGIHTTTYTSIHPNQKQHRFLFFVKASTVNQR